MKTSNHDRLNRRQFIRTTTAAGAGLSLVAAGLGSLGAAPQAISGSGKPAVLGGTPLCSGFPKLTVYDQTEEQAS